MQKLFSNKDILFVFGADRRICGRLNKRYLYLKSKVEKNREVSLEDRDSVYYAGLSILRHEIIDFMAFLEEFKECKLITVSKYVSVVHELNGLIETMEKECVWN